MSPYRTAAVSHGSHAASSGDDTAMVCVVLFLVGAVRLVAAVFSGAAWDAELTIAAGICFFAAAGLLARPRVPAVAEDASPGLELALPPRLLPATGVQLEQLAAAALAACLVDDSEEGRTVARLAHGALGADWRVADRGAAYFWREADVRGVDFAGARIRVGPKDAILTHLETASLPRDVAERLDAIDVLGLRALVVVEDGAVLGLVSVG